MDIDTPGVNIKDNSSDLDLNTDGNVDKRVKELEIEIQKMVVKHETKVDDLTAKLEDKQNEYDGLKIKMDQLVKENGKRSDESKNLKKKMRKLQQRLDSYNTTKIKMNPKEKPRKKLIKLKKIQSCSIG